MTKEELRALVHDYGDAIITYRSQESNKQKYNVCTLDFSTPYIMGKQNRARETDDTLLTFCWDTDSFRLLKASNVLKVESLSGALQRSINGTV